MRLLAFAAAAPLVAMAWEQSWPVMSECDKMVYTSIFEPRVTGVLPSYALRNLTLTESGEIRHYGEDFIGGKVRRVYASSGDIGLTWKTCLAEADDPGAMVKSPLSGDWITIWEDSWNGPYQSVRSRKGPGDTSAERRKIDTGIFHFFRQPVYLPVNRKWAVTAGCSGEMPSILFSADDGQTWTRSDAGGAVNPLGLMIGADKSPRWENGYCEPALMERRDGSLVLLCRTAFDHPYSYTSRDGGRTWSGPDEVADFWMSNTMPTFFRLKDGRLVLFWNNTQPLPKMDNAVVHPELGGGETTGKWESVFTNRDILHAAISEDDGETWIGWREVLLNPIRNETDFRERGNYPPKENDKSVHQSQALELPDGKVLVACGQNAASRRFVIFDVKWLYETERYEDFSHGLEGISHHLFVKSLAGGARGWAGHCAYNRMPGVVMSREPDTDRTTMREAMWLARIPDNRVYCDRTGVAWNFPAARKGVVEIECRLEGKEFWIALSDHWINPSDEYNFHKSPVVFMVDPSEVGARQWITVCIGWKDGRAALKVGDNVVGSQLLDRVPRHGLSYLHLRSTRMSEDRMGTYFRSFKKR